MQSDIKANTMFSSTVRSCAEKCEAQDDFVNCTIWQLSIRGCVKRTCCDDDDLCNSASTHRGVKTVTALLWSSVLALVVFVLTSAQVRLS
jgi:hypothetical protein